MNMRPCTDDLIFGMEGRIVIRPIRQMCDPQKPRHRRIRRIRFRAGWRLFRHRWVMARESPLAAQLAPEDAWQVRPQPSTKTPPSSGSSNSSAGRSPRGLPARRTCYRLNGDDSEVVLGMGLRAVPTRAESLAVRGAGDGIARRSAATAPSLRLFSHCAVGRRWHRCVTRCAAPPFDRTVPSGVKWHIHTRAAKGGKV